ncbi:hypothetical protein BCR33DRAFT_852601 [Rhizoclosmatium globosum]|uniref:Uncharacterized protein n=1 Tax=Rhizoclosmatium globosum TaxID=329046 RepID=A0A1Y2C315_9FUNG|nr:hypothetical protein BCR33DRAFT_852601 [Rhizoclosmatium globosum]|eukprot:ORY40705.1 hypothetical protein BCR33DRAFT_852601 [Rhizoclosmatium globosum]
MAPFTTASSPILWTRCVCSTVHDFSENVSLWIGRIHHFQLQKFANAHPSKRPTLPVFLDEAQIMLTKHLDMFLSSNTLDTRPLYIAVTRAHRKIFFQSFTQFPLAVLGTELSLDLAKEAITSSVLKQKYMDIIISNCYDSPEAVQKYLEPTIGILPRKYAALLVGRPRLASSLIENHFLDPSQSISALVMKLFNQEANEMSTRFSELYTMFPSSKASIDGVLSLLDDSLGNYLLGKGPIVIETSLKLLFESGIGRLKSDKNGIRVVELSEPFVIAGFMRTSRERTLESSFEFESLVALKVVETLKHPQPVENCAFLTDSLKKKFAGKLIKLRMPFVEGHPSFIQALNSTTSSLVQFLTSPSAPIAAPDIRTGPDLVAVLEILSSTLFLEDNILLLIQCKYVKDAVDLDRDILRTTTFSRLFTAKNGETYLSRSAEFINLKAALPLLNIKYTCGAGVIFPAQFSAQKLSLLRNHASNSNVVLFAASDEEKLLEPNLFDDSEVLLLNELKAK